MNEFQNWRRTATTADLAGACALICGMVADASTDGVTRDYWTNAAARFREHGGESRFDAGALQWVMSLTSHAHKRLAEDLADQANLRGII
jgi:hypothetical protein